jgi:hypothetical protein
MVASNEHFQSTEREHTMRDTQSTFEDWMAKVDAYVERLTGCSAYDLPDYGYRDAYDDGQTPLSVARAAIRESGFSE